MNDPTERLAKSLQYKNRYFIIAYKFEGIKNIPFEKICTDNENTQNMYLSYKDHFNDLVEAIVNDFSLIIDNIRISSLENPNIIYSYAVPYLNNITKRLSLEKQNCADGDIISFLFDVASYKYKEKIYQQLEVYNNKSLQSLFSYSSLDFDNLSISISSHYPDFINFANMFTSYFLQLVKAANLNFLSERLLELIRNLRRIDESQFSLREMILASESLKESLRR